MVEGKTTLLDSIQLALFGKLNQCSNRGTLPYEEFLRRCIHKNVSPHDGTCIELEFSQISDGKTEIFRIIRSWAQNGSGIRENLEVYRNATLDEILTENWLDHVDQFIPVGLAELFFFDGERIEQLAESSNASQMLSSAINSLLGIDLVDRLENDLDTYSRNLARNINNDKNKHQIDQGERQVFEARVNLDLAKQDLAAARNNIAGIDKKIDVIEHEYRSQGGVLYEQRKDLESEHDHLVIAIKEYDSKLRELASGIAPLAIIENQIELVKQQAERETETELQLLLASELEKRDAKLLRNLDTDVLSELAIETINNYMIADRKQRLEKVKTNVYLNLDRGARNKLLSINQGLFRDLREKLNNLLKERSKIAERISLVVEKIDQIPDDNAIHYLLDRLQSARAERREILARIARLKEDIIKNERVFKKAKHNYAQTIEKI